MTDRKLYALLERAVLALETLAKIEPPIEAPKPPPLTDEQRRGLVSVIHRGEKAPEWNGRGIPPGGGDRTSAEFWGDRRDPEAARMKKKTRLPMGRPL